METAMQVLAVIQFIVIGMSHILQPRAWAEFFIWLQGQGHAGVFVNGFLSLVPGSLIVSFHNVWTGIPTVLTVMGWAQVVKALICFWAPAVGMRSIRQVSLERAHRFVYAGIVFVALGALLGCALLMR